MIAIDKIIIKNYRKFSDEVITLGGQITAISGSNNAGKTSLVELMSTLFTKEKRDSLRIDDLHIRSRLEDEAILEQIISNECTSKEVKFEELRAVSKRLNKISIGIVIKYEDDDNLEKFSCYLADVDINKRNYYFLIEYEYGSIKDKDIIEILDEGVDFREVYSYLVSKIYYCDERFENKVEVQDKNDFYDLFNFHCVYAIRKLADRSEDKQNFLSKHLLKTVQNNTSWKDNLKSLIKNINNLLNNQELSKEIDTITLQQVKTTLDSFSKTNGGNTGKLGIDFKLENKDIEKVLLDFIQIYFEQDEGVKIKEQKQGLGYSNLIYLLLEAQIFNEKMDAKKVNLLIFEEPEAHLHPQMENIFIRYISNLNKIEDVKISGVEVKEVKQVIEVPETPETKAAEEEIAKASAEVAITSEELEMKKVPFQMLITTHSSEMTKTIGLNNIRVLRPYGHTESKVYDLNSFINLPNVDRKFYEKFFQFSMVDMVFADKLILFEGDAERLLFKYLISNVEKYKNLASQYISYIQVGGAYAHKYIDIINFLEIKTLIFTDIDYEYKKEDIEKDAGLILKEIKGRKTTNETIKEIVGESIISKVFIKAKETQGLFLKNKGICTKFQTDTDGYARTLEDAILHKLLNFENVFSKVSKSEFEKIISDKRLLIANTSKSETSLRDRIDKLKNKTDSMYALIESGNIYYAVPNYIEEGLDWLKD
jgi:putative ATP-dependent endonuclease of the OLD family